MTPLDPARYPLAEHAAADLRAGSGRPLDAITPQAALAGELTMADLQIRPETLRAQAAVARRAGYPRLAENLERAAELTGVPNDEILRMYHRLRPERSTFAELMELAELLEGRYEAPACGAFVREAAAVYQARGLLR